MSSYLEIPGSVGITAKLNRKVGKAVSELPDNLLAKEISKRKPSVSRTRYSLFRVLHQHFEGHHVPLLRTSVSTARWTAKKFQAWKRNGSGNG